MTSTSASAASASPLARVVSAASRAHSARTRSISSFNARFSTTRSSALTMVFSSERSAATSRSRSESASSAWRSRRSSMDSLSSAMRRSGDESDCPPETDSGLGFGLAGDSDAAGISVAGGLLDSSFGGLEGDSPNPKNDANVDGDAGGVSGTGFSSD